MVECHEVPPISPIFFILDQVLVLPKASKGKEGTIANLYFQQKMRKAFNLEYAIGFPDLSQGM